MRSTKKGEGEEVAAETESVGGVVIEVERREEIEAIETEVEDIDIEEYSICLPNWTILCHKSLQKYLTRAVHYIVCYLI